MLIYAVEAPESTGVTQNNGRRIPRAVDISPPPPPRALQVVEELNTQHLQACEKYAER